MRPLSRTTILLPALVLIAACNAGHREPVLDGRAVLPADTFSPGPSVGALLDGTFNGRTPPFATPPVQGFSSLILDDDGTALALGDNGFGARANSPAYPLRWYRLALDFDAPGTVAVVSMTDLTDPRALAPFARRGATGRRPLTGADFDPESFVRLADGTFWIGEEFGPFLLHVDADGALLDAPMEIPLPTALQPFGRGRAVLHTPDHPDLQSLNDDLAVTMANLPRSGGLEGLALAPDGRHLYVLVEKALLDDPERDRRLVLEFDATAAAFTGRWWTWRVDGPDVSLAAAECTPGGALLATERDSNEGPDARIKRIYRAPVGAAGQGEDLAKTLVIDLLAITDPDGLTTAEAGAHGLGRAYAFPYVTPECLAVVDGHTLLVANDNNYPFSAGRRAGLPDDNEFIRLKLPGDLDSAP